MYGYGTGTASLGIQYVARILHAPNTGVSVENGYGQLVIEMGIVGLFLWITLGISISISAWKIVKRLRGSPWFPIAFVIFWFVFILFFPMGYNTISFYQDFLVNAYFWVLVGVLYRLPSLAPSVQFAASTRTAPVAVTSRVPLPQPGVIADDSPVLYEIQRAVANHHIRTEASINGSRFGITAAAAGSSVAAIATEPAWLARLSGVSG